MKKTILLVGNSQLSFFVAKQLAEAVGDYVHLDVTWLTTTEKIYPVVHQPIAVKTVGQEVEILRTAVKSINLNDQRVVTGGRIIHYDLLFVDQTPVFSSAEREKISDQFETLMATVRSQENRGVSTRAKVFLAGATADGYQLAIDLAVRSQRDSSATVAGIKIEIEPLSGSRFADFMKNRGVSLRKSQYPGFQVKPPVVLLPSKKIRGLRVDLSGRAILLATGEPGNRQSAIIVEDHDREMQNIARADWQLARRIVANMLAKLEGGLEKPLDQTGRKLILVAKNASYLELGGSISARTRARAVLELEKRFWRKF